MADVARLLATRMAVPLGVCAALLLAAQPSPPTLVSALAATLLACLCPVAPEVCEQRRCMPGCSCSMAMCPMRVSLCWSPALCAGVALCAHIPPE